MPRQPPPARPAPAPRHEPLLLKLSEVGRLLSLSPKVIRGMVARGELPARRIAARWMVPTQDFLSWMQALPGVSASEAIRNLGQQALIAGVRAEMVETDSTEMR